MKVSPALWLKTLLVHGASWTSKAYEVATRAILNERNALALRDEVTAILGRLREADGGAGACVLPGYAPYQGHRGLTS